MTASYFLPPSLLVSRIPHHVLCCSIFIELDSSFIVSDERRGEIYTFYWWKVQSRLHFWTRRPPEKCWANRLNEYTIYFQRVSNKISSSQHSVAERGQRRYVTWKGCRLLDSVWRKKKQRSGFQNICLRKSSLYKPKRMTDRMIW